MRQIRLSRIWLAAHIPLVRRGEQRGGSSACLRDSHSGLLGYGQPGPSSLAAQSREMTHDSGTMLPTYWVIIVAIMLCRDSPSLRKSRRFLGVNECAADQRPNDKLYISDDTLRIYARRRLCCPKKSPCTRIQKQVMHGSSSHTCCPLLQGGRSVSASEGGSISVRASPAFQAVHGSFSPGGLPSSVVSLYESSHVQTMRD
jgi:hypothetical protein